MDTIDFEDYLYYPTLRTRNAELKGLAQLDADRKKKILPLITLGKWPKSDDFYKSAEKAAEAVGDNPFFVDLPDDPRHHSATSSTLLDPKSFYKEWRDFVSKHEHVIPIVQLAGGKRRDVVQEARLFEASHGKLGFRIRDFQRDTPLVIAALSALDEVENALVFVDAQYIRSALPAYIAAVTGTINALRTEVPETLVAVLSTSFPASRTQFLDASKQHGAISILDRELHQNIGGSAVAIYGDYASIHAVVYDDQPIMRWSPTIDYALEYEWVFERRPDEDSSADGYGSAAKGLVERFPEIVNSPVWGDKMIAQAAAGDVYGKAPQNWIAVRVNLHLTRQIDLPGRLAVEPEDDDLDF